MYKYPCYAHDSSIFFKIKFLEKQRLRRIKAELEYAAKWVVFVIYGGIHIILEQILMRIFILEEVLKCFAYCRDRYGMQSYTMSEMVEYLKMIK